MTPALVLPVGGVTESHEQVWVDAEWFRLELTNTSTDNRSTEHARSQLDDSIYVMDTKINTTCNVVWASY